MGNMVVNQLAKILFCVSQNMEVSGTCISEDFIFTYLQHIFILRFLSAIKIPEYLLFLCDSCRLSLQMLLGATGREEKLHVFLALLEKHFCCCFEFFFFL